MGLILVVYLVTDTVNITVLSGDVLKYTGMSEAGTNGIVKYIIII